MDLSKEFYPKYSDARAGKSPLLRDCLMAFLVGGAICAIAQGLYNLYLCFGISEEVVKMLVPVSLIFLTGFFTGIGWFDLLAKRAGAGTLVPITGFANAVVAPAIDNKDEGYILGVGAKMFIIAGPVIVYGTVASVIYGVIYYMVKVLS